MSGARFSAVTHVGCVRKINEDAILARPDLGIWVVADGMGGHAAGDFASQTVVDQVAGLAACLPPEKRVPALRHALDAAHARIRAESARRGEITIGAAVVALVVAEGQFAALWSGDCRLYRFRDDGIEMLTTDHSVVAALVAAGRLTWDQAEGHPQGHAITRAIGVANGPGLDSVTGGTRPGDRFLLCSDGLNRHAGFETLRRAVRGRPVERVSQELLQLALDGGGRDNISIIAIDVG